MGKKKVDWVMADGEKYTAKKAAAWLKAANQPAPYHAGKEEEEEEDDDDDAGNGEKEAVRRFEKMAAGEKKGEGGGEENGHTKVTAVSLLSNGEGHGGGQAASSGCALAGLTLLRPAAAASWPAGRVLRVAAAAVRPAWTLLGGRRTEGGGGLLLRLVRYVHRTRGREEWLSLSSFIYTQAVVVRARARGTRGRGPCAGVGGLDEH